HGGSLPVRYGATKLQVLVNLQGATHDPALFRAKLDDRTGDVRRRGKLLHAVKHQAGIVGTLRAVKAAFGLNVFFAPPIACALPARIAGLVKAQEEGFAAFTQAG